MDTVQAVYTVQVVDTVQVVNNSIQSGDMGFTLWIQIGSSVIIAIVAVAMLYNARAVMRLEETKIKIAMMPIVIDMLNATYTFLKDISDNKQKNKYRIIDDYFKKVEYVWLFLKKDSELLGLINNLMGAVNDLNQIIVKREEEPDNPKLSRDWTEKSMKIQDIYKDIRVKCNEIFGFAVDLIPPQ